MILVDASVLIEYVRRLDPKLRRQLASADIGICGATRAEVMQGARDETDPGKLLALLDAFRQIPIPEPTWDRLGQRLNQLRKRGVAVPFPDAIPATIALDHDAEVWALDSHFPFMAQFLPLKLYQPPP